MSNKVETFLSRAGRIALHIITFGAIAAEDAAPFLAPFDAPLATLLSGSASIILAAESAGAAAPATDTGTQKAALAVASITPLAEQFAAQLGLPKPNQDEIKGFSDALVSALNRFRAPTTQLPTIQG